MEILNVDAFSTVTRQIKLEGKTYPVEDLSVQQFIDNLKAAEELGQDAEKLPSLSESFEKAVVAIKEAIPTLDENVIRRLKLPAMTAVLQFVRGEPVTPAPSVTETVTTTAAPESDAEKKQD